MDLSKFKPMLAEKVDLTRIKYPVIVSPKLDGFRATFINGSLVTRSLKPFPNKQINSIFQSSAPLDGELIWGDPTSPSVFRDTSKVVTAFDADIKEVRFFVFDIVTENQFNERLNIWAGLISKAGGPQYIGVPHAIIENEVQLLNREEDTLKQGFEGLMIRSVSGPYKFGRSTVSEGYLLKLKRHLRSEATVIGFEEQMHNNNELIVNALGYAERSSHQANLSPMGVLGALKVQDCVTGVQFNIGTGFDAEERREIWINQHLHTGTICSYEYLPVGVKDKPRHPVFKGWRMKEDIT